MNQSLLDSIKSFAPLIDALNCGAVLLDRAGVVCLANDRICAMLNRSRADVVGRELTSLYPDEHDRQFLRDRLAEFDQPYEGEFHVPSLDRTANQVIISGRPLGTEAPQRDFRLVTISDITMLKKADAERREEIETISRLSDTVLAQALELKQGNARLEERVRERTKELHEANMEAIYMLAVASEAKDADTGSHVRRIENLCRTIARAMGLSVADAERIAYSAILHDVGKMLVPDQILKKPGPLDGGERSTMELHAVAGERILSKKPFFEVARQIARSHHENWDGSGYPDRLSGQQIPLPARIVHLADVFDALTSERVYKPPWTPEKAVESIADASGRFFDPDVVRAFKSLVDSNSLSTLRM